eukprot:TRINITY_DN14182_c0_g1_i1.p1 TRINITY_DN14182_c0_g1~~TRINITY_DN14182_c0_g1_i1.p1  ORF type:complete len:153 (+),score=22.88 TRINITY_DN14182_c0_g1_i1:44-502(+)
MCPFLSNCSLKHTLPSDTNHTLYFDEMERQTCCSSVRSWSEVNFLFGEPQRQLIKGRGGEIEHGSTMINCRVSGTCDNSSCSEYWSYPSQYNLEPCQQCKDKNSLLNISREKQKKIPPKSDDLYKQVFINSMLKKSEERVRDQISQAFANFF